MKARFATLADQPGWVYWMLPDGRLVARILRFEFDVLMRRVS